MILKKAFHIYRIAKTMREYEAIFQLNSTRMVKFYQFNIYMQYDMRKKSENKNVLSGLSQFY